MSIFIKSRTEIARLSDEIRNGTSILNLSGLTSIAAKAYILSKLQHETDRAFVIITDINNSLETWETDLSFFASEAWKRAEAYSISKNSICSDSPQFSNILALPSFEADIYSGTSPHAEIQERRALALWNLAYEPPAFLVVSAKSLITKIPALEKLKNFGAILKCSEDFPPEKLTNKLFSSGYVREDPITNIGEFSIRGGVVDVWPPNSASPVRIEFFGDTIDSIRLFDVYSQLSINYLEKVSIAPMREFSVSIEDFKSWVKLAEEKFADKKFARNLRDRTDFAKEGEDFSGWEFLIPLLHPRESSIFDYSKKPILIIDEPIMIEQTLSNFYEHLKNTFEAITENGEIGLGPDDIFLSGENLRKNLHKCQRLELRSFGRTDSKTDEEFSLEAKLSESKFSKLAIQGKNLNTKSQEPLFLFPTAEKSTDFEIGSRSTPKYRGDVKKFAEDFYPVNSNAKSYGSRELPSKKLKCISKSKLEMPKDIFAFQSNGLAERFNDILQDYKINLPSETLQIGKLSSGFEIPSLNFRIYSETEIFGEKAHRDFQHQNISDRKRKPKTSAFISDFRDLKPGDFVVHIDHGIGKFEGLQTIDAHGVESEFLILIYKDNTKLFVPVERLDLVSRYGANEGAQPKLDRLGGLGWQKTKALARRAMRDMADELLRLYAERKLAQGIAFSKDTPWQKEFEEAFTYKLTDDQKDAIKDVKNDMETATPMDRLIVGDVGYGKTEIAMRAAFKAVMDGKQAAVLAPTTVLSHQHFETFKQRFSVFPTKIDMLSRFRSRKEQRNIVELSEKGDIDILIGTHRILSNDVKFSKLGLVIVDEEQRFGVADKEKLKQFKKKVDVLTLTATPIPRTLNMSMVGIRDMSVIETPPRNRLAISTQVVQFSENVIKSAIELELSRNGQVFFIHNRVQTIETIAVHIQKIAPNARIIVGHGQMGEKRLERVMLDFIDYKYDVLVSTTIIENGIDIPRANTIIINRADNYGLSQLYQLRGRVGRSSRRAYAHLLIPSERELMPVARRRLSAIREFSDLGAGFRIAALDLELRGAGNLLGGQQSGHLDSLGFDLYTKMLNRTIQELRGEEIEDEASVFLNLGIDVSIPHDYIVDTGQRLRTYKRISSTETEKDLRRIYAEINDRYGKIPDSVKNLFKYAKLRQIAEEMRVVSVDNTKDGVAFKLSNKSRVSPEKLTEFIEKNNEAKFSPNGILRLPINEKNLIKSAINILTMIRE